nr:lipase maturation factor family protein [Verrucomicrobiota bacterium]
TLAWFANLHPEWFKKFSVAFCLVVEIIVPFFLWAPRRLRYTAAALLITLQIAIALTGNYCFFNLLTIALCVLLLDDTLWRRRSAKAAADDRGYNGVWRIWVPSAVLVVTLPFNLWLNYSAIFPDAEWPRWLGSAYSRIEAFRIVNGYGLFRVMTKERPEIQIEGSADGIDWTPYEFKWKPGDVNRAPRWVAPHQPRLDWQMWFAALGSRHDRAMVANLMMRLLENESSVTPLLARNPFATRPPRFVRAVLYKYEFTNAAERRASGAWWKRREIGEYLLELSLPE